MKAISHREHQALLTALLQLDTLLPDAGDADESNEQVQILIELYQRYETLISDLAACIAEYEGLHHHLKVSVLAPALRQARKTVKSDTIKYRQIQQYVKVVEHGKKIMLRQPLNLRLRATLIFLRRIFLEMRII